MTSGDFKKYSTFKAKGTGGFMIWLKKNGIASKSGDLFILNQAVISHIKKILG